MYLIQEVVTVVHSIYPVHAHESDSQVQVSQGKFSGKNSRFFSGGPGRLGGSGGTKIGVGTGPIVSAMKIYTTLKKISTKTVHYEKS